MKMLRVVALFGVVGGFVFLLLNLSLDPLIRVYNWAILLLLPPWVMLIYLATARISKLQGRKTSFLRSFLIGVLLTPFITIAFSVFLYIDLNMSVPRSGVLFRAFAVFTGAGIIISLITSGLFAWARRKERSNYEGSLGDGILDMNLD